MPVDFFLECRPSWDAFQFLVEPPPPIHDKSRSQIRIYIHLGSDKGYESNMLPFWTGWNLKPCQDFKVSDVFFISSNAWDDTCVTQFAAEMIQCQIRVTTVIIPLGLWSFNFRGAALLFCRWRWSLLQVLAIGMRLVFVFAGVCASFDRYTMYIIFCICVCFQYWFKIECICLCISFILTFTLEY